MNPFDYVNSISLNKKHMMKGTENDELAQKEYSPFLVNRALSYYTDTILYANEMNMKGELDNLMQYEYLFHSIRSAKRFNKWAKTSTSDETLAISKYFNINIKRAEECRKLFSREQIQEIIDVINKL